MGGSTILLRRGYFCTASRTTRLAILLYEFDAWRLEFLFCFFWWTFIQIKQM